MGFKYFLVLHLFVLLLIRSMHSVFFILLPFFHFSFSASAIQMTIAHSPFKAESDLNLLRLFSISILVHAIMLKLPYPLMNR